MEENKVFVSEEEAIKQLDKIDENIKKNKTKKKKIKEPKPRKPKYMKSAKKDNKIIIIVLCVILVLLLIALVVGALLFYFEKDNLSKIEKDIIKSSNKYYESVKSNDFKGMKIIIKDKKIESTNSIKLKNIPNNGEIRIDEDGVVSYAIKSNFYCIKKNAYDEKSSIKFTKECNLDMEAYEYILKNKEFKEVKFDGNKYDNSLDYASKYYVSGANPNNYIVLANRCFRIVNIANNNHIKAIYDGYYDEKGCNSTSGGYAMIERTLFDASNNNIYSEENAINKLLSSYVENKTMNDKIKFTDDDMKRIADAVWYVGAVSTSDSIDSVINKEQTNRGKTSLDSKEKYYEYNSKIGLINVSDYLMASSNEKCNNMSGAYSNANYECNKDNYLYLDGYPTWTMNAYSENNNRVWRISAMGSLIPVLVSNENAYIRPVIYIKGNNVVSGKGTKDKPYIVK